MENLVKLEKIKIGILNLLVVISNYTILTSLDMKTGDTFFSSNRDNSGILQMREKGTEILRKFPNVQTGNFQKIICLKEKFWSKWKLKRFRLSFHMHFWVA